MPLKTLILLFSVGFVEWKSNQVNNVILSSILVLYYTEGKAVRMVWCW